MLLLETVAYASVGGMLLKLLVNALVLMLGAYLLSGVEIQDFARALILAVVLGLLNATLGAVLDFITTPLRWLTLGLFSLVIDAIIIKVADYFMKGFAVRSFGWALLLAGFMAIANALLHL